MFHVHNELSATSSYREFENIVVLLIFRRGRHAHNLRAEHVIFGLNRYFYLYCSSFTSTLVRMWPSSV
jgi:hypothetical protein